MACRPCNIEYKGNVKYSISHGLHIMQYRFYMMYRFVISILHDIPLCKIDITRYASHVISNIGKPLFSISHGMCPMQNRFYMTCMPCHIEYGKFCKPPDSILHGILAMSYRIWKFYSVFGYVDSIPHSERIHVESKLCM